MFNFACLKCDINIHYLMNSPFMHRLTERIIEILVSLFLLLTIFPWIYLVMAIVVKRRSPGPAIVRQLRRRSDGGAFQAFCFRLEDKETLLARSPQLLNMLRGDLPMHITIEVDGGEPLDDDPVEGAPQGLKTDDASTEPRQCIDGASSTHRRSLDNASTETPLAEGAEATSEIEENEPIKITFENVDTE